MPFSLGSFIGRSSARDHISQSPLPHHDDSPASPSGAEAASPLDSQSRHLSSFCPKHARRDALRSVPRSTQESLQLMRDQRQIWEDIGFAPVGKRVSSCSFASSDHRRRTADRTYSSPAANFTMTPAIGKRNVGPRHYSSGSADETTVLQGLRLVEDTQRKEHRYHGKGKGRADCRIDSIQPKPAADSYALSPSTSDNGDEDMAWLKEMLDNSDFLSVTGEDFLSELVVAEDLEHAFSEAKHDVDVARPSRDVARFLNLTHDKGVADACASSSSLNQSSFRHKHAKSEPAIPSGEVPNLSAGTIPSRSQRRQFSHDTPLGSRPQDRSLRAVLKDTKKSCDSSSASHTTTHLDTYASSTDQCGTASTAPTIADSEGEKASKVITEDTDNGSEIEV